MQAKILDKLRQFDSATICNVIELFEVRPRNQGFMLRGIGAAFPNLPPMVGFASTVTCRTFVPPVRDRAMRVPDLIERFAELSGPAVVVIQNLDSGGSAALFGDVMCTAFRAFGAAGLVTNGPGRDLAQVAPLQFPVFCDGLVCSHGYNHLLDAHVPVQVGGIIVAPDDLLHGDGNGVAQIPTDIAPDVADACAEFAAAEKVILDLGSLHAPSQADLRAAYHEKERRVAELAAKLRASKMAS